MSFVIHDTELRHDGGTHNLEVEIDGTQAIVRFGSSFTLRLDERGVNQLADVLQDTLDVVRGARRGQPITDAALDVQETDLVPKGDWNPSDPTNW
tara:strand:- start:231 stop:515 length:285 start_codon:yes stop_codon:yes gene_type:complete